MDMSNSKVFSDFPFEFRGKIYHQQIDNPTKTQAVKIEVMVAMEVTLEEVEEDADDCGC